MAADGDEVSLGVLVEELEVFGEAGSEGLHGLLVQAVVVLGLSEFLGFVLEDHFDLLDWLAH